jgi:predicted kinase
MSKGPGKIQRFILDTLNEAPEDPGVLDTSNRLWPVPALAGLYATRTGVADTPHLRAAFRRAARTLADRGRVDAGYVVIPTRREGMWRTTSAREVLCVWQPGTKPTHRDAEDAGILFLSHAYHEPEPFQKMVKP